MEIKFRGFEDKNIFFLECRTNIYRLLFQEFMTDATRYCQFKVRKLLHAETLKNGVARPQIQAFDVVIPVWHSLTSGCLQDN